MIQATLLNQKDLEREWNALPDKIRTKALRQAIRDKGKEIFDDAKANARETTPRLARTMKLRALKSKTRGVVGIRILTGTREELGIPASDRYYWPAAIELGTRFIEPRAFMRRAIKKHEATTLTDLQQFMRQRIETVVAQEIKRGLMRNV